MPGQAETLLMQGHQARREHRLDDAKGIFAEAVELVCSSKDRLALAEALAGLGQIERDLGEVDAALLHYREAEAVYQQLDEPLRYAHTVRHIADLLRGSWQFGAAAAPYREALEVYRGHPETPPLDLANAIRGYALLQEEIGEKQEAIAMWREARELYAQVCVQAGVDEGDRRIARLSRIA